MFWNFLFRPCHAFLGPGIFALEDDFRFTGKVLGTGCNGAVLAAVDRAVPDAPWPGNAWDGPGWRVIISSKMTVIFKAQKEGSFSNGIFWTINFRVRNDTLIVVEVERALQVVLYFDGVG